MKPILLVPIALGLLSLAGAAQTTWYVDVHGTAPGSGTSGDPYTSIQYALDQASTVAGDTLRVAPGVYVEFVFVTKAVRIESTAGPLATELRNPAGTGILLFMDGNAKPVFEGFTLAGPASTLVYQDGGRVVRCILDGRGATKTGFDMFLGSAERCTIAGCQIGVRGDLTFDSALELYGCVVWHNGMDVFDVNFTLSKVVEHCAGLDGDPKWLAFGPGNVIGDPELWAVEFGDFLPRPGSPCIDAGHPMSPLDPDGSAPDIGALSFDPGHFHGPIPYCAAKPSSRGCLPAISASGVSSATQPGPFFVSAAGIVENKVGILIYGEAPAAHPFQGGTLCVEPPLVRTKPQASGSSGGACSGAFAFNFNRHVRLGGDPALVPGALVFAQYWFRDKQDPQGFGTGLTDAVRFGIGP